MKKLTTLIIITSVFLFGCVTTEQNKIDTTEEVQISHDAIYVGDVKVFEIIADFQLGDNAQINLELHDLTGDVKEIMVAVESVINLAPGSHTTKTVIFDWFHLKKDLISMTSEPVDGCVTGYGITQIEIVFNDDSRIVKQFSSEEMSGLFEGVGVLWRSAETEVNNKAEEAWYKDSTIAALVIREDKIIAKNLIDGREVDLVHMQLDEFDHQEEGLGYEVHIVGEPLLDYEIHGVEITVKFHEDRNWSLGGEVGFNLGSGNPWERHFPGNEKPRYEISHASIITAKAFFDDSIIMTAVRGGDWNNPFTLPAYSFSGSENWYSNPDESSLYSDGAFIHAYNLNTGEDLPIMKMEKQWIPDQENSRNGKFKYQLTDLTDGTILGGVFDHGFRSIRRPNGGNCFLATFRFDAGIVIEVDTDFESGEQPSVYIPMWLDKANQELLSYGNEEGTIAFKDGNVLPIIGEDEVQK